MEVFFGVTSWDKVLASVGATLKSRESFHLNCMNPNSVFCTNCDLVETTHLLRVTPSGEVCLCTPW